MPNNFFFDIDALAQPLTNTKRLAFQKHPGGPSNDMFAVLETGATLVYGPVAAIAEPIVVQGTDPGLPIAVFQVNGATRFEVSQEGVGHFPAGLTIPCRVEYVIDPELLAPGIEPGELSVVIIDPSYFGGGSNRTFLGVWHEGLWRLFEATV